MNNYIEKIEEAEIKSVAKALTILDYMSNNGKNVTLKKLTEELRMPKSTIAGLLKTLKQYNFVDEIKNNEYGLGIHLFELGSKARGKININVVARPYLEELAEETQEQVNLAILDHHYHEVLLLDQFRPLTGFQIGAQIGTRIELHCTALGKVLLSNLPEEKVEKIYKNRKLTKKTPYTITNIDDLKIELRKIKEQEFAVDNQELIEGMKCISAPIFNNLGENVAAISISSLVSRLQKEKLVNKKEHLVYAAHKISKKLYHNPSN